jgi:hypothetical protein
MPERGPVQFLLPFLSAVGRASWKAGVGIAAVFATAVVFQSLRQTDWNQITAQTPETHQWPWSESAPTAAQKVPRLGLSAAVVETRAGEAAKTSFDEARASAVVGGRDPHLGDDQLKVGDRITVTTASGRTLDYRVTSWERLEGEGTATLSDEGKAVDSDPHCARTALSSAIRLIIETINFDPPERQVSGEEHKL